MAKIIRSTDDPAEIGLHDPIWTGLAYYLAGYVKNHFICVVFKGDVPSFGRAAILKVWVKTKEKDRLYVDPKASPRQQRLTAQHNEAILKSTVSLTQEIVFCTDCDHGITEIELCDPEACDKLITWMVKVGIASKKSKWVDPI